MLKNKQHYIIFDIDSSSVGTLVFDVSTNSEVFTIRRSIDKGENIEFDSFFRKTIKTFKSVAEKAHKHSGNNIAGIFLNISSPWVSSQNRVIHFEKENEFIFTEKVKHSILEKETNKPLSYTSDFIGNEWVSIIENRELNIFINGYLTRKTYNKKAKSIDIHKLVSVMSDETMNSFISVIEHTFHIRPELFSNKFMNYKSIINLFKEGNDVLNIDVSGEVTELSIILKNRLVKIGTIPSGISHIIRHLSRSLNISYLKAESIIIMYQNNEVDIKYRTRIEESMRKSFLAWFKNFYDFLDEASKEYIIPSTIHLISQESFFGWLSEWILKTEEISEHIHSNENISILDTKGLFRQKYKDLYVNITDDNLMMCLNFVNIFYIDSLS